MGRNTPRRRFLAGLGAGGLGMLGLRVRPRMLAAAPPAQRPNFVFFLIDDMGWRDVGCFGSTFHETPNIDQLARRGMRFTDGYAACPVCSPTRASIMTGTYPARLHLTNFLVGRKWPADSPLVPVDWRLHLPAEEVTIAEALKAAGYATCHVGKWHLGGEPSFLPENQGFDVNIGGTGSGAPRHYFYPEWKGNPPIEGRPGEYLTDRLTGEAIDFIRKSKGRPFFLYLSHYAVHIPIHAKQDLVERYARKVKPGDAQRNPHYAAMVHSVDESVGSVLRALDELGIAGRTIIIFMSDNGGLSTPEGPRTPATSNAPLRAGKGYLYEGGIREPWIVVWPGTAVPGSICSVPVTSVDFFPTMLDMAGLPAPPGAREVDGESIVPLLKGGGTLRRAAIYWHYPHYSNQGGAPGGAIREGHDKLIEFYETGAVELYDLEEDLGETKDLARVRPDRTAELKRKLAAWRAAVGAQMPARRASR